MDVRLLDAHFKEVAVMLADEWPGTANVILGFGIQRVCCGLPSCACLIEYFGNEGDEVPTYKGAFYLLLIKTKCKEN